jgi:hypothetical protein
VRRVEDQRRRPFAARAPAQRRELVGELVDRGRREIDELQLDDRAQPGRGEPDAGADDRRLGERRVAHAARVARRQALGEAEHAALGSSTSSPNRIVSGMRSSASPSVRCHAAAIVFSRSASANGSATPSRDDGPHRSSNAVDSAGCGSVSARANASSASRSTSRRIDASACGVSVPDDTSAAASRSTGSRARIAAMSSPLR